MNITIKYHLKIKKIMGKDSDVFEFTENQTLREVMSQNISPEILNKIDEKELLIIHNGKNYNTLDILVNNEGTYCLCPKLYGG